MSMSAQDVAVYLQENPAFFDENAELLAHLSVSHPHNGQAISLTERQLLALREKIRQLEHKFAELIRFGEENDEIGTKTHRLVLSLLAADDFDAVRHALMSHLQDDFAIPHVAVRIWNSVLKKPGAEFEPVSEALGYYAGDMLHPYCGEPANLEVLEWFGEGGPLVRSVCLVPLRRDAQVFGLLALGSEEAERFYPEMGTLYVTRLGELLSAAVQRQLG